MRQPSFLRLLYALLLGFMTEAACAQSRPNIILILADDMGYGDLGCYGQSMISTPQLDALAAAGMRFTQYYAGSSVCAPSREALLTGRHTGHTAIRGNFLTDENEDPPMPLDKVTLAEYLHGAGYATALYGKWGLGGEGYGPERQGFDSSFCYLDQIKAHNYYPPFLYENGRRVYLEANREGRRGACSHDLFVDRALSFIGSRQHDRPFFLYLPFTFPHGAYTVPVDSLYASRDWKMPFKVYASMISRLDRDVGRIMAALRAQGLDRNTLVLFASDNGANPAFAEFFYSNGRLRGAKRDLYEGGIRAPLIACWPGKIPAGSVCHRVTAAWDILPTLCSIAGLPAPAATDGASFRPALQQQPQPAPPALYWAFYEYNYNWYKPGNERPRNYLEKTALRWERWKGVRQGLLKDPRAPLELYDLSTDTAERHNVAALHPDVVQRIETFMRAATRPDPPYFPYAADSSAPLHTLQLGHPGDVRSFFRYTPDRLPFASAHRGGPALGYPENCLATFTHTLRHTWAILEVDPHYTRDSAIVLMHDPTLDRTSTGKGRIADHTLAELRALRLKDPRGQPTRFGIPTLEEAIAWARGKTMLLLDQKDVPAATRAAIIRRLHAESCAMVMAYTYEDARKVYAIDPDIMMEVFIPDRRSAARFEQTGVPWSNVVAFVTHDEPKDSALFRYLHDRGVLTIRGSSRHIDRQYSEGQISKQALEEGYGRILGSGADIIEADLGVEAGQWLESRWPAGSSKAAYFRYPAGR